jgi:hypothetical protein
MLRIIVIEREQNIKNEFKEKMNAKEMIQNSNIFNQI